MQHACIVPNNQIAFLVPVNSDPIFRTLDMFQKLVYKSSACIRLQAVDFVDIGCDIQVLTGRRSASAKILAE